MNYSYAYALLGLLYYPLQQFWFYSRFGRFNTIASSADLLFPITGVLSFVFLVFLLNKTPNKHARTTLWIIFLFIGVPLSLIGSMSGGLLGTVGVFSFGLVPTALVLLLAYGIAKLLWKS